MDGGGAPPADPDRGSPARWRWIVTVFRIATALVAIEFLATRHRWFQFVAVPLSLLGLWWDWRVGAVLLTLALIVFLAYRLVVWVIDRLLLPRKVRRKLSGARHQIRDELDRLDLPTGPVSGLRFAWRLLRGKRPHAELRTRMDQGLDRLTPLISDALTDIRTL